MYIDITDRVKRVRYKVKLMSLLWIILTRVFIAGSGYSETADKATEKPIGTKPVTIASLLDTYIPNGYMLRDTASGNLNRDGIADMLLLIERIPTVEAPYEPFESRPLKILYGTENGVYKPGPVDDKTVLCKTCGDTLSDPYSGMSIKNGSFSVVHKGRYKTFWNRTTTFTLVDSVWLLQKDMIKARSRPDELTYFTTRTKKDFGTVRFELFDIYNADEYIKSLDNSLVFPIGSQQNQSSFCDWQIVKGGIWKVLNYCTGKVSPAYLTFFSTGGIYEMFINLKKSKECEALAFKNASYLTTDSIPLASFDSTDSIYFLGTDTLSFKLTQGPPDEGGYRCRQIMILRNKHKQKLRDIMDSEGHFYVNCCGDINRDGYIDAVLGISERHATTIVYLSKVANDGTVAMAEAGKMTFTD